MFTKFIVTVAISLGFVLLGSPALADGQGITNTGVSAQNQRPAPPNDAAAAQIARKDAAFAAFTGSGGTRFKEVIDHRGTPPRAYKIPSAANMKIRWQLKSYTCGPASLRNMILVMNHVHGKGYVAPSEATLESWLGTTRSGTGITQIANVLNKRYSHFGGWRLWDAPSMTAYRDRIRVNTFGFKQPVIQGVQTDRLKYFNGKKLHHFNFVYGYNLDTGRVNVGEVWNPVKIYGYMPTYGNPYGRDGHRAAPIREAFEANDISCPNCSDRRRLVV